jgi:hypothetical protein
MEPEVLFFDDDQNVERTVVGLGLTATELVKFFFWRSKPGRMIARVRGIAGKSCIKSLIDRAKAG